MLPLVCWSLTRAIFCSVVWSCWINAASQEMAVYTHDRSRWVHGWRLTWQQQNRNGAVAIGVFEVNVRLFSSFGLAGDTVNAIKNVVANRLSSADDVTVKGESLGPRYRSRPTPGPRTPVHALEKRKKAQRGSATNFNRNPKKFKFATMSSSRTVLPTFAHDTPPQQRVSNTRHQMFIHICHGGETTFH